MDTKPTIHIHEMPDDKLNFSIQDVKKLYQEIYPSLEVSILRYIPPKNPFQWVADIIQGLTKDKMVIIQDIPLLILSDGVARDLFYLLLHQDKALTEKGDKRIILKNSLCLVLSNGHQNLINMSCMSLEQLKKSCGLYKEKVKEKSVCPICIENISKKNKNVMFCSFCSTPFHKGCYDKATIVSMSCPVCRGKTCSTAL